MPGNAQAKKDEWLAKAMDTMEQDLPLLHRIASSWEFDLDKLSELSEEEQSDHLLVGLAVRACYTLLERRCNMRLEINSEQN